MNNHDVPVINNLSLLIMTDKLQDLKVVRVLNYISPHGSILKFGLFSGTIMEILDNKRICCMRRR